MPPLTRRSLLLFALPLVLADVDFTTPAAGSEVPVGTINVAWKDNGRKPVIEELTSYTLALIVGGNEESNQIQIATLVSGGVFTDGYSAEGLVEPWLSGPVENGFFLKITSGDINTGLLINYSDRFTITGMNGTVSSVVLNAVKALDGNTAGPPRSGNVPILTSSSSSSSPSTTSPPSNSKPTTSDTPTVKSHQASHHPHPASNPGNGLAMAAIAGIVVSVLVGVSALMGLIIWTLLRRRRRRKGHDDVVDLDNRGMAKQASVTTLSELSAEGRVMEIGDGVRPPEMDSNSVRAELEGDSVQPTSSQASTPEPSTPQPEGMATWGPTPLTPIAPSVFEATLESPIDYHISPTTPVSRL